MENNSNPTNQQNRTVLKKVKRPINRMMPQQPQQNTSQNSGMFSPNVPQQENPFIQRNNRTDASVQNTAPAQSSQNNEDFNLDEYLDGGENLPIVKQPVNRYHAAQQPAFIEEEDLRNEEGLYEGSELPPYLTKKVLILLAAVIFFVGFLSSRFLFAAPQVVRNGLQGVVVNPEVPRGRARCGVAEKTQGCVLYIMNPQRQELNARDFYDLASQLTGRQRFVIETGNMRYSNTKIRPGDIAQLNIPPL